MTERIRFYLPDGSLSDSKRKGYANRFWRKAGYDKACDVVTFPGRPEAAFRRLAEGWVDIAISGNDWAEEWRRSGGGGVRKFTDLDFGRVKIVNAVEEDAPYETLDDVFREFKGKILVSVSEYPYLTRGHFMENDVYRDIHGEEDPVIRGLFSDETIGTNNLVQILHSSGKTEYCVKMGKIPLVTVVYQSGRTLEYCGLRLLDTIMESEAGLYYRASLEDEDGKLWEKALEIRDALLEATHTILPLGIRRKNSSAGKPKDPVNFRSRVDTMGRRKSMAGHH